MGTTNRQLTTPAAGGSSSHGAGQASPGWLSGRRDLVVGVVAAAAAAIALVLSQHWLTIADLVPLLAVLPCAVMMFHCMKGMNRGQQTDTAQASLQNEAGSLPTSEAKATDSVKWAG
jgi:choline-glycine betaine transporter